MNRNELIWKFTLTVFFEIVTKGTTYSTQIIIIKSVDKKMTKGFYI
jgi:hypothetical protein